MKKLMGAIGLAVIAMAIFFSTNLMNSSKSDLDLATIISINSANAESSSKPKCEPGGTNCSTASYCRKGSTYGSTCSD